MRMKRILVIALLLLGVSAASLFVPEQVLAAPKDEVCQGVGAVASGGCNQPGGSVDNIIATGINIFGRIIGIVGVIMLMVGGFKYQTSGGDPSKASGAKNTIIYALIGLVIAGASQAIVWFVLDNTTTDPPAKASLRPERKGSLVAFPAQRHYAVVFNTKTVL